MKGHEVTVHTVDGKVFEGIFRSVSEKFDVALSLAHEVTAELILPTVENTKEMVFGIEYIVTLTAKPELDIPKGGQFATDREISSVSLAGDELVSNGIGNVPGGGRQLQAWTHDDDEESNDDDALESAGRRSHELDAQPNWPVHEMFAANVDRVQSDFDETMQQYTTVHVPESASEADLARARQLAEEIEKSKGADVRAAYDAENTDMERDLAPGMHDNENNANDFCPVPSRRSRGGRGHHLQQAPGNMGRGGGGGPAAQMHRGGGPRGMGGMAARGQPAQMHPRGGHMQQQQHRPQQQREIDAWLASRQSQTQGPAGRYSQPQTRRSVETSDMSASAHQSQPERPPSVQRAGSAGGSGGSQPSSSSVTPAAGPPQSGGQQQQHSNNGSPSPSHAQQQQQGGRPQRQPSGGGPAAAAGAPHVAGHMSAAPPVHHQQHMNRGGAHNNAQHHDYAPHRQGRGGSARGSDGRLQQFRTFANNFKLAPQAQQMQQHKSAPPQLQQQQQQPQSQQMATKPPDAMGALYEGQHVPQHTMVNPWSKGPPPNMGAGPSPAFQPASANAMATPPPNLQQQQQQQQQHQQHAIMQQHPMVQYDVSQMGRVPQPNAAAVSAHLPQAHMQQPQAQSQPHTPLQSAGQAAAQTPTGQQTSQQQAATTAASDSSQSVVHAAAPAAGQSTPEVQHGKPQQQPPAAGAHSDAHAPESAGDRTAASTTADTSSGSSRKFEWNPNAPEFTPRSARQAPQTPGTPAQSTPAATSSAAAGGNASGTAQQQQQPAAVQQAPPSSLGLIQNVQTLQHGLPVVPVVPYSQPMHMHYNVTASTSGGNAVYTPISMSGYTQMPTSAGGPVHMMPIQQQQQQQLGQQQGMHFVNVQQLQQQQLVHAMQQQPHAYVQTPVSGTMPGTPTSQQQQQVHMSTSVSSAHQQQGVAGPPPNLQQSFSQPHVVSLGYGGGTQQHFVTTRPPHTYVSMAGGSATGTPVMSTHSFPTFVPAGQQPSAALVSGQPLVAAAPATGHMQQGAASLAGGNGAGPQGQIFFLRGAQFVPQQGLRLASSQSGIIVSQQSQASDSQTSMQQQQQQQHEQQQYALQLHATQCNQPPPPLMQQQQQQQHMHGSTSANNLNSGGGSACVSQPPTPGPQPSGGSSAPNLQGAGMPPSTPVYTPQSPAPGQPTTFLGMPPPHPSAFFPGQMLVPVVAAGYAPNPQAGQQQHTPSGGGHQQHMLPGPATPGIHMLPVAGADATHAPHQVHFVPAPQPYAVHVPPQLPSAQQHIIPNGAMVRSTPSNNTPGGGNGQQGVAPPYTPTSHQQPPLTPHYGHQQQQQQGVAVPLGLPPPPHTAPTFVPQHMRPDGQQQQQHNGQQE